MEQILIKGLELETIIGVYDWERTQLTKLRVDLVMDADLTRACHSDDVNDTVDYAAVAATLEAVAAGSDFELLEALGQTLCDKLLAEYPLTRVDMTIEKPGILPQAQVVAVRLVRGQ
ncbi:dihydroneopterin aldolase [Alteromonas flava]|uniref:dihydroneopterin aldolase n=1 Tax=Alteromonas flava TaxID=2048003 RepID=UPI000C293FE7|nr:dihydroneopterin aldolase [Alteromonas flava]